MGRPLDKSQWQCVLANGQTFQSHKSQYCTLDQPPSSVNGGFPDGDFLIEAASGLQWRNYVQICIRLPGRVPRNACLRVIRANHLRIVAT